ncbi:MAG: DUF3618 domain-containing protein [Polyangiales bacterium]
MTSTNGIGNESRELSPAELQLEIARTKSAITEDLRVLSERFNPGQLRESAREVMRDAREEATQLVQDAKQAALGPLLGAKDRAVERVHALGEQTRHAGVLTLDFLTRNRVMMSLLGVASGLLVYALRRPHRLPGARADHGRPAYRFEHYSVPLDEPPMQPRESADYSSPFATRRSPAPMQRDSRGVVIAATVFAGIGLGLLLPIAQRPRRALARAGERVWDEARHRVSDARRALQG